MELNDAAFFRLELNKWGHEPVRLTITLERAEVERSSSATGGTRPPQYVKTKESC